MRLDLYLVENGYFESRARAQDAIKAGLVRVAGDIASKASQTVGEGAEVAVEGERIPMFRAAG